jgi:hypothetical protein
MTTYRKTEEWYTHKHKPVCEYEDDIPFYGIKGVHTDREVIANSPDMTSKNKTKKARILIDVAIPADRNVVQKEAGKKLKYKSLCMEIRRMWNVKYMIIKEITGATGIATRGSKKVLKAIPGTLSIDSLQNTDVLGTSHIIRKVV